MQGKNQNDSASKRPIDFRVARCKSSRQSVKIHTEGKFNGEDNELHFVSGGYHMLQTVKNLNPIISCKLISGLRTCRCVKIGSPTEGRVFYCIPIIIIWSVYTWILLESRKCHDHAMKWWQQAKWGTKTRWLLSKIILFFEHSW